MAEESHKVSLHVYDLSRGLARQLSVSFLGKAIEGIWHTAVVVYGNEYYFGGGIQHDHVGATPYGKPLRVVDLGVTHVPKDVFEMYLEEISPLYTAETYSLLSHNCNNFSNDVAQFLVGKTIPEYILNLPNEVMGSPMAALILPMIENLEATMKAGAVPQVPQFKPSVSVEQKNIGKAVGTMKTEDQSTKSEGPEKLVDPLPAAVKPAEDPLGDARKKVQEEINREFAEIMATGTLRASEAAALAAKKVMQKYGQMNVAMPQS